jgi:hypothetical protein
VGETGVLYYESPLFDGHFVVLPDRIELSTSPLPRGEQIKKSAFLSAA